ncbi:MAG: hypothetical protein HY929_07350 [Euryarchaeota archaeon]|nr:hypothetical protein [Euryarchaeota archaeon]
MFHRTVKIIEIVKMVSIDIDIAVNPDIVDSVAYATIVEIIKDRGYVPRKDRLGNIIPYSFDRKIISPADNKEYNISVDFLSIQFERERRHKQVQRDLLARTMRGCDIAFEHYLEYELIGILPGDGETLVGIKIADVVGCITTKGFALKERYKEKDAYDVYSITANYKGGPEDVAAEIAPYVDDKLIAEGIDNVRSKFSSITAEGPTWVANFLNPSGKEEKERIIADAFMNVNELIRIIDEKKKSRN